MQFMKMRSMLKFVQPLGFTVAVTGLVTLTLSGQIAKVTARPIPSPVQVSQVAEKANLDLLAKVSAAFVRGDRYQTESDITVTATSGSTQLVSTATVTTIVESPNKFRAEITFSDPKATINTPSQVKSIVVSDGKQVWLHRPDLNQYAVMTDKEFNDLDDNYWMGMSSLWFLQIPPDVKAPIAKGALSDPAVQKEIGLSDNVPITGKQETVNGQQLYVYEYIDNEQFTIQAVVDPNLATLQQIVLTGKSDDFDIVITERIRHRIANPKLAANSFKFTPAKTVKQVKSLKIGPL